MILIIVGMSIGLSSLYFVVEPLPIWLKNNSVASFLYTNTYGNFIYLEITGVIGYIIVYYALYIIWKITDKIDQQSEKSKKQTYVGWYDDDF